MDKPEPGISVSYHLFLNFFREKSNENVVNRFHTMLKEHKEEEIADDTRKKEYRKEIDELVKDEQERKFQNDNLDKEISDLT